MRKLDKKTGLYFLFLILIIGGVFVFLKDKLPHFDKVSLVDYKEVQTDSGLKIFFLKDDSLPFVSIQDVFP